MDNKYKPIPFWSWNDELDEKELTDQIEWMHSNGIGGFFMHARGGLTTPYLGEKWFKCVDACLKKAKELDMEAYAYDENGWPSGFAGGKLLEDENNRDMYLTYKIGKFDKNAIASFDISSDTIKKVNSGDNVLNVYTHISTSTADILNKEVVKKFISLTHEKYKQNDAYGNLRGFFTDEPQYYRWGTSFTRVLPAYFSEKYNENIFDRIGLLFVEKDGYQEYRYKYYKALHELMLDSWAKQIYSWCDSNGYKLTGHYVEEAGLGKQILCCGGVMPFYEYEHIPGIDHLGRDVKDNIVGRQLGSVMSQLGKKQGLCEMFACAGWDATPMELKRIAEYYMVNGVNVICHHLLPYSEHGQRKRDYPEHYSKINPWVNVAFKDFNDHFSSISELLANSSEITKVGILMPIRSGYMNYKREIEWDLDFGLLDLTNNLLNISNELSNNGVMFHYLDETIMAKHGSVNGRSLIVGECRYDYVIIPEGTLTMDKSTKRLFEEYASNGGKFLIVKDKPIYLEGEKYDYSFMRNNCSLEEIINDKPYSISYNKQIRLTYRETNDGKKLVYAMNMGDETTLHLSAKGYRSFKCGEKILSNDIEFNKYESKILFFSNEEPDDIKQNSPLYLNNKFEVIGTPLNYLTLDYLRFSKDGVSYSELTHYMGVFNVLLKDRYQGDLYLKYEFEIKEKIDSIEALIEDTHIKEVTVNGHIIKSDSFVLEKDLWSYHLDKYLQIGKNEIVIKMHFYESEQVYYALFGENVQESIKNCLAYDTTIEAIYLRGPFGVYGDFKNGNQDDIVIGNNFYIAKQKKEISSLITEGYPLFSGVISLTQSVEINDVHKDIVIPKRFQLIDLYVNNKFVKRMLFENKANVSKYLVKGTNTIRIDLVVSNRNLLGPHHDNMEEPLSVGPNTFERFNTWDEKGRSPLCLDRYSFVKTII